MALPLLKRTSRKYDQILAIDLGGHTTKAVQMQRKGEVLTLMRYALLTAPISQKGLSPEMVAEHLKSIVETLETKIKPTTLAIGVNDSLIRQAELPQMPVQDMRQILKNNPKAYLQQDLSRHIFDCHITPPRQAAGMDEKTKVSAISQKFKVLVAGAKEQLVTDLQTAMREAGLIADGIVPGIIGPINAFELAMPEIYTKNVVALVDLGFKNTTICILQEGELILTRVLAIGGDRITSGLAEAMGISYAEAEGIKTGMPGEVQPTLEVLITPLGRELRASIDFFEHQQDKHVAQVFVSGAAARSEFFVKILESELMVPCQAWSPIHAVQLALPPQQMAEVEQVAPQLTVAVGTAAAAL